MHDTHADVLVVGAGPTGLTVASELLRHGLSVRVVDAAPEPPSGSRAMLVQARTLEALAPMGCAAPLIARGQRLHGVTLWAGGAVVLRSDFDGLEGPWPFALGVSQTETETVLQETLTTLGGAVERGVTLEGFRQDGAGVTARLTRGEEALTVRAAWLVGCDGAHGTVRRSLGVPIEKENGEDLVLLADLRVDWDTRDDRIAAWWTEEGMVVCYPMGRGRWRVAMTRVEDGSSPPTLEAVEAMMRRRTGSSAKLSDMAWASRFRAPCGQVETYRDDRALLVGDAAFVPDSFSALGMNMGIQDAHNLAWKLAMVHRGHARSKLLDTYHDERHGAGRDVLNGHEVAARLVPLKGPLARARRDELGRFLVSLEAVQRHIADKQRGLGEGYVRSPLSVEHTTGMLQARIGTVTGGESPTVTSIRAFDKAPAAGWRARDGRITVAGEAGTRTLFEVLDTRRFNVLLFDGRSDSAEGYQRFAAITAAIRERYLHAVDVTVVTPRTVRPPELPIELCVLLDPDGELEARYGALTECVYVLRPDLYVGYRAQPADQEPLLAWLGCWLRPDG